MKKKVNYGFTLVEIIAVIIIIGILALIAVPAISQYVSSSQDTAYTSHEENMRTAAKNMTIDCLKNNKPNCKIPDKGHKNLIYLEDIIKEGYITEIKDPKGNGMCSNTLSYVEIENTGNSNYNYTACLYCGEYKTEDDSCVKYSTDGDMPVCGTNVIGESTKWTNKDRTVTIPCTDETSGCTKNEFSKTFKETTNIGNITIADQTGNTTDCPVNVYVDKDLPTCALEIIGGTLESAGWYSGDVKVKLTGTNDVGSGVLTYGIGTSIEKRNYNKATEIELKTGYTTVIGYVKDIAGNEGICSIDVRLGVSKPEFEIEYGYQIYPNQELYQLGNMTESGTVLTSTNNDPQLAFSGLSNYKNVNKVIIHLNSGVPTTTTGQIFYSNAGHSEENSKTFAMPQGATRLEAEIPKGTYSNIRIDLGSLSEKSYNINKIELIVGDRSNLYSSKGVSINLIPINNIVSTTGYSFDDGNTWQTSNSKVFTQNYNGKAKIKNDIPLISLSKDISISTIETTKPTLSISAASGTYKTSASITLTATDTGGSNLSSNNTYKYCLSTSNTSVTGCTWTTYTSGTAFTISGTNQTRYLWVYPIRDNAGNINENHTKITTPYVIGTYKFDSTAPTLSITSSISGTTATIKLTATDTGGSGLSSSNTYKYCLSTSSTSVTGCTWTAYTSGTQFTATGTGGYGYLWVYPIKDNAENVNDGKSFGTAYLIKSFTFDATGPTCSVSVSQNNHPSGVSFTWSCSDPSGISGTASATVSNRTSNWSTVVKDSIGNPTTISVNIGTKTQYRYRNCSAQNCSNITEIQEHCQPSIGPDCVYGGYSTPCKNQYGNSMKYYCGIEVVIGQTCSGCKTWGSWSAYGDTAYSATGTRQVETRTVYYRK